MKAELYSQQHSDIEAFHAGRRIITRSATLQPQDLYLFKYITWFTEHYVAPPQAQDVSNIALDERPEPVTFSWCEVP